MELRNKLLLHFFVISIILFTTGGTWPVRGKGYHSSASAGIGTQTESDNFNRTDGQYISVGGSWQGNTVDGLFIIAGSGTLASPELLGDDATDLRTTTWGDDQFSAVKVTVTGTSAGCGGGAAVRCSGTASTWYRVVVDASGNYEVGKHAAGSFTSLRTGTISYSAGTELGISATGGATTTIKIWYGGTQVGTNITDSSSAITTGKPGIAYSSAISAAQLDDWRGGTVP